MYDINAENVELFAYANANRLNGRIIKGIVIEFHGLGGGDEMPEDKWQSAEFAQADALYVYPYYGPWSWMNDVSVKYCDDVLDALIKRHSLVNNVPIVSIGGSMGGLSSLVFACRSRHNIVACAANSPVCDLITHYSERKDLPRTLHLAFGHYALPLDEAIKTASPLHIARELPDIPYYIVHGDADMAVNKALHSDRFVEKMRQLGRDIEYIEVPGMRHCDLPEDIRAEYNVFVKKNLYRP